MKGPQLGADAFLVCYGLRWDVSADNQEEVTLLERRQDPRQVAARGQHLDTWWGATAAEGQYFILVGKLLGHFGWENQHASRCDDEELARIIEETKVKLLAAGFDATPAWHFQFEPDY